MTEMKRSAVIASVLLGLLASPSTRVEAATHTSCDAAVQLTKDAEKRQGGALYEGPMESTEAMPETTGAMPGMTGAHEMHMGRQGGVFFMAPNKIQHIEARYSKECGIQVFVYNAFTEPISVKRFQAFFKIIPEDESEWDKEVTRFLSPTAEGGILQASGDHDIKGPFKIELYVKFPESDDAQLFNIPVGKTAP